MGTEAGEQFPAGLRVLAVDDEPTCLRILEILLTSCKYRVRTTNRALEALQILRENEFDLVISDVHMPDMDGLKLLELVGLEMDLPVIMLSANADPKVVMKGIDHGACDYLLKPIRVEELKNIWQHVVRKKKHDLRNQNISTNQHQPEGAEGQCSRNIDPNENTSRKRKEQDDEVVEETDDNDDPSAPKKPRVVWSMDLHRKFVYAVNQLGLDKAVPKKILDLMNVEKLTRENVASHLQKYRVYLKRRSSAANRQVNMGNPDSNYFQRGGTDGLGSYHAMAGSAQLHNSTLNSYPPMATGMLGQLNGLPCTHNNPGQFQQGMFPLLQGMPTALELEELRNINDVNIGVGGLSSAIDDNTVYSGFPEATVNQSSSVSGLSSHLPDHVNWSNAGAQPNTFPLGDSLHTPTQLQYRRTDVQGQAAPCSIYGNAPAQGLNFYRQDAPYRPNFLGSPANCALGQSLDSNFGGSMNIRQPNFVNQLEVDQQGLEQNPPGSFASPNFGSLEDLATAMLRQRQSRAKQGGYYPPRTSQ